MSGVRNDLQIGLRPCPVQFPGARDRTDNIIHAVQDDRRDMTNPTNILDQEILSFKERIVHKIMAFDARKCRCKLGIAEFLDQVRILEEFRGASLPDAPGACSLQSDLRVFAGQSPVISSHHVTPFRPWNYIYKLLPDIREDPAGAILIEPLDLFWAAKKNAAQNQLSNTIGMSYCVCK